MIQRDPEYYVTGYEGKDPREAPFYLRSLFFDGKDGDLNASLVSSFNALLQEENAFSKYALATETAAGNAGYPSKIVIIDASHDDLPTSRETVRVFEEFCGKKGYGISVSVVNSREGLMEEIDKDPGRTLLVSQCVDKNVYNVSLVEELQRRGVVIVPGRATAPGGVFSDKDHTYRLLSDGGRVWSDIARYKKVPIHEGKTGDIVDGIFAAMDELEHDVSDTTFFVKPHEGGGGLGGFRITKQAGGYLIPDLSKVTGEDSEIHPTFIDFDVEDEARLRELLWIYRLFAKDEKMSSNYLSVKLPILDGDEKRAMGILKDYLAGSEQKRRRKLRGMLMDRDEARKCLVEAIEIFEKKFCRRYIPLVNEHIDFGLWGLRAHYRLGRKGPVLETMYHRIFQLGFTEEGLGYVGADNISNKQTGDLEITRLGPVNEIMLAAIGGETSLFETLRKGVDALAALAGLVSEKEFGRVPLRLQLDLAAVSRRIGEGNADTARGLCLASRWTEFVRNAREWLEDSLAYYAWKKDKG